MYSIGVLRLTLHDTRLISPHSANMARFLEDFGRIARGMGLVAAKAVAERCACIAACTRATQIPVWTTQNIPLTVAQSTVYLGKRF